MTLIRSLLLTFDYYFYEIRQSLFSCNNVTPALFQGIMGKSLPWKRDKEMFKAWREGKTGVPFVDANMRELLVRLFIPLSDVCCICFCSVVCLVFINRVVFFHHASSQHTGWMSNRGRQNVASFLVKDIGLDWRLGAEW